jgi:ankyrin repeat protein
MLDAKPGLIDARRDTATPLHAAVDAGRTDVVKALLDFGPELSLEDGEGRTPLLIAMLSNHQEIVDLLRARMYFD